MKTVAQAQEQICPTYTTFTPQPEAKATYDRLYDLFKRVYFDFGRPHKGAVFADVLPTLIDVARG